MGLHDDWQEKPHWWVRAMHDNGDAYREGEHFLWFGEWYRSPEEIGDRERNPIMKLYRVTIGDWVMGDVDGFEHVGAAYPPPPYRLRRIQSV